MRNRKKIYTCSSLLLFTAVLAGFLHEQGLWGRYNYLSAHTDLIRNRAQLLIYGEPDFKDQAAYIAAKKTGLTLERLGGCTSLSSAEMNGIEAYNKVVTHYLDKKLGPHWHDRYEALTDSIFFEQRVDTIKKVVLAQPGMRSYATQTEKQRQQGIEPYITVLPHKKDGHNVEAGIKRADGVVYIFDYFYVDPYTLKVGSIQY